MLTLLLMKTKKQFFRENIIIAFILSIPLQLVVGILLSYILQDILYYWITLIIIIVITIISILNDWYNDYRFEELEKQIKQLKDNQNVHIQQD